MSRVAITKGNAYNATKKALELTNFKELIKDKKRIVIKPNLTTANSAESGITTDINVVRAILDFIPDTGKVVIAEGAGGADTEDAFQVNGYYNLEKEYGVKVINTHKDEFVEVKVKKPLALETIKISKTVFDSDFLISVAKLKIHSIAKVTGTLKNMMGACPIKQKSFIHAFIPKSLVDLASVKKPDFGVIDGIIANEIDECFPHPIKMGIILAGKDCVALDSIASRIMRIDIDDVYYLRKAGKLGLGEIDDIEVIGERIEDISKNFRRAFIFRSEIQKIGFRFLFKTGLYEPARKIKNSLFSKSN